MRKANANIDSVIISKLILKLTMTFLVPSVSLTHEFLNFIPFKPVVIVCCKVLGLCKMCVIARGCLMGLGGRNWKIPSLYKFECRQLMEILNQSKKWRVSS